jgi:hypothetical protein
MTKPYLYQVEYIESTGTQYIDTGFTGDQNTRIKFDFQLTDTTSIRAVFGSRTYNGTNVTRGRYFYPILGEHQDVIDRFQLGYGTELYRVENITTPNAKYVIDLDKNVVRVNGIVKNTFTTTTFTNPSSILLFNCHTGSSGTELDTRYAKVKVYSCQIWDNGIIARDFIPVIDNQLIPALYDRVNGVMYYNRGTGQFNIGSIVTSKSGKSPLRRKLAGILSNLKKKRPYYCEVEYLESDGSQYIDTGVLGNGEFDVDYIYRQTQDTANAIFAGTRSSSQHLNFGQRSNGTGGGFSMAYLGNFWIAGSTPNINTDIRVQISYKNGSQSGSLNGTALTGNTLSGTEATNLSIYLFKRHHYGTDDVSGLVGRIYYFKIWNNGLLVRDYIPVLDWNYTPCMYDKVTGQLFYNQGT